MRHPGLQRLFNQNKDIYILDDRNLQAHFVGLLREIGDGAAHVGLPKTPRELRQIHDAAVAGRKRAQDAAAMERQALLRPLLRQIEEAARKERRRQRNARYYQKRKAETPQEPSKRKCRAHMTDEEWRVHRNEIKRRSKARSRAEAKATPAGIAAQQQAEHEDMAAFIGLMNHLETI